MALEPSRRFAAAGFVLWAEAAQLPDGSYRASVMLRGPGGEDRELTMQEAADLRALLSYTEVQAAARLQLLAQDVDQGDLQHIPHVGRA